MPSPTKPGSEKLMLTISGAASQKKLPARSPAAAPTPFATTERRRRHAASQYAISTTWSTAKLGPVSRKSTPALSCSSVPP